MATPAELDALGIFSNDPLALQKALATALGGAPKGPANPYMMALANAVRGDAAEERPSMPGGPGGQRAAGNLALLTGDKGVLVPYGMSQIQQSGQQQAAMADAQEAKVGRALKLAMADQEAREALARQKETERHNREMESRPPSNVYLPGADGQYFVMPSRGAAPASGVVDGTGAPVIKPATPKQMSEGEKNTLQELTEHARSFRDLRDRFKDWYAGDGLAGDAKTMLASKLGSLAPEKEQEAASYWADFGRLIDLPERNATFGASLSAGEKASWESAKNIKRGSDPALVRRTFDQLLAIAERKRAERAASLKAEGYNTDAVDALSGQRPPDINLNDPPSAGRPAAPTSAPKGADAKPLNAKPFEFAKPVKPKPGGVYMFNPKGQAFWVPDSASVKARERGWKDVP